MQHIPLEIVCLGINQARPEQDVRCRMIMVAASTTLVCAAIWVDDPTTPPSPLPVCPTKALLGIGCPGCGSLRMLYSLMHGNLPAAATYNALGLAAVLLVWAYAAWTYGRLTGRRIASRQHRRWSAAATLSLLLAWFVVRNIPFAPSWWSVGATHGPRSNLGRDGEQVKDDPGGARRGRPHCILGRLLPSVG
jgi:hypothetical protein